MLPPKGPCPSREVTTSRSGAVATVPQKGMRSQVSLSEYFPLPSRVWPLGPGRCSITWTCGSAHSRQLRVSPSGPIAGKDPREAVTPGVDVLDPDREEIPFLAALHVDRADHGVVGRRPRFLVLQDVLAVEVVHLRVVAVVLDEPAQRIVGFDPEGFVLLDRQDRLVPPVECVFRDFTPADLLHSRCPPVACGLGDPVRGSSSDMVRRHPTTRRIGDQEGAWIGMVRPCFIGAASMAAGIAAGRGRPSLCRRNNGKSFGERTSDAQ